MSAGNDVFPFSGAVEHLTLTLVNPYTGDTVDVDADYNLNTSSYDGELGLDELVMTALGDALFLEDAFGNQTVKHLELITAGDGNDIVDLASLTFSIGNITINGDAGNDILWSSIGNDILNGGDGDDNLIGGHGNDALNGDAGDDVLNGGRDADALSGGAGNDTLKYHTDGVWTSAQVVNLVGGPGAPEPAFLLPNLDGYSRSFDTFDGGADYDTLVMTDGDDALFLEDTLSTSYTGLPGARLTSIEEINAGLGNDVVDLATSHYLYTDVTINGEEGNDWLRGGSGNDTINGGVGNDALRGYDGHDTLHGDDGVDLIVGGKGNDTLYGDAGADSLFGGANNDTLYGGADNDTVYGETGNDTLYGEDGNDRVVGSEGVDSVFGGAGNDQLYGGSENDALFGGADNDSLYGEDGVDELHGESGSDIVQGGHGNDTLYGEDGIDNLFGNEDNDTLYGGSSNDLLNGQDGNDTLYGGTGADKLYGGAGADTFVFLAADLDGQKDTVQDFRTAQADKIDISDLLVGFVDGVSDIDAFLSFGPLVSGFSTMTIDRDGAGGVYSAVQIAKIATGGETIDAQTMYDNGHILV